MKCSRAVIVVVVMACGGSRDESNRRDGSGAPASPALGSGSGSETAVVVAAAGAKDCVAIFDRVAKWVAPTVENLGLTPLSPTTTQNTRAMGACGQLAHAARACLRQSPIGSDLWDGCGTKPLFTFYDSGALREQLLGAPVTPADSARRVAALAGEWTRPGISELDETVTWKLGRDGSLAVTRTTKEGSRVDPPRTLAFVRERQLGVTTGTTTQYVPVVVDGPRIHLSWTSGAFAVPLSDDSSFAVPLADRDRWLGWTGGPTCALVDPQLGATEVPCAFEGADKQRFVFKDTGGTEVRWQRIGKLLVPPDLEVMARTPARTRSPRTQRPTHGK
ncbi:MAG: hypothetical protein AB7P03_08240 [Kofleriaceae bacterium]